MRSASIASGLLALALATACADQHLRERAPAPPTALYAPAARASAWPFADALFRHDPTWLGADAAVSIPLDAERVLWLFGDSFIATPPLKTSPCADPPPSRADARMVRNSVGVQTGLDPSRAAFEFAVPRAEDGAPTSFFAEQGDAWFWPASGVYLDGELTVFLQRVRADATPGGLGFRSAGWTARRVRNPRAPPERWTLEPLVTPDTGEIGLVGAAVVSEGEFVYAFGVREPGDHALLLLRWSRAAFTRGDLGQPEYFGGATHGFGPAPGVVVIAEGATEFSVSRIAPGRYVQVQSRGFGAAPVALRFAPALEGPWSAPLDVYRPEEAARPGVLLYAARAHPELRAGGDLVLTYASNTLDAAALTRDMSLYFPRFVRIGLR